MGNEKRSFESGRKNCTIFCEQRAVRIPKMMAKKCLMQAISDLHIWYLSAFLPVYKPSCFNDR